MHLARRVTAGAHGLPACRRKVIESGFSQDGAARVTRAQEKDVHIYGKKRDGKGVPDKRFRSTKGNRVEKPGAYMELLRSDGARLLRLIAQRVEFTLDGHTV